MLLRAIPYGDLPPHVAALQVCKDDLRPFVPRRVAEVSAPLVQLMRECWETEPLERPDMVDVERRLAE